MAEPQPVLFVGAGPGSADLLTLAAARALDQAQVVIHDRLVGAEVLALIGPAALRVEAGKQGFGPATPQDAISALIVTHARRGLRVVRLKGGDPGLFGRLDEETAALDAAGLTWRVIPGITAAVAAAAGLGVSLTRRGRNGSVRLVTGHDVAGFAEQDWRGLARPGEVAAIYMGKRAARFVQGRLMMHGADPATPVTLVENAARPDERVVPATLAGLPAAAQGLTGPVVMLYGLTPRAGIAALAPREVRA